MKAVNIALESPLLDSNDIYGTKNILLNIISGKQEITMGEIGEIIETLQERAGQEAEIIWGNGYDESLEDKISVTILATGFITNPNQTLQPKAETKKYDLNQTEKQEEQLVETEDDFFKNHFIQEKENAERESEKELKFENESNSTRGNGSGKGNSLIDIIKGTDKRKPKTAKPVPEPNVDNWFYKNFGLGKLFEDDEEDRPMR
jgi:cell division protein FtsZ